MFTDLGRMLNIQTEKAWVVNQSAQYNLMSTYSFFFFFGLFSLIFQFLVFAFATGFHLGGLKSIAPLR